MIRISFALCFILLTAVCFSQSCLPTTYPAAPLNYGSGTNGIVISGYRINNPSGACITLSGCTNITITNCMLGPSAAEGIHIENCSNITITNCSFMDNSGGVYAVTSQGIKVDNNQFWNVQGPGPRGQFVQFDKVYGTGNEINNNVGENIPGNSNPQDMISVYMSNGTAASPILVQGNSLRGGGPSPSGGGIMTGDNGGSYVTVSGNTLVDPGQYGIAIAGGHDIQLLSNKVYGRQQSFTNVGMYVWNQYAPACYNPTVQNNAVNFTKSNGTPNSFWGGGGNCGIITGVDGTDINNWNATFGPEILPDRLLCPILIAYYKFNNTWNDLSGGLPLSGNAALVCDGHELAAGFDTSIETLPWSPWLKPSSNRITVSCWIKPDAVQGIQGITHSEDGDGWNDGWRMLLINNYFNPRIVTSQGAVDLLCGGIVANAWNHVVMTYDGKNLKGYVNGVLQGTIAASGNIVYKSPGALNMRLGYSNGDNYYFNGKMDEFKFYNGQLTDNEILQDYNASVNLVNAPPASLALTSVYTDNGQSYTATSSQNVEPGDVFIHVTPSFTPDTYISYSWNTLYNYQGSYVYGNGPTAYLQLQGGDVVQLSVTGTTPCGSFTQTMLYDASLESPYAVYPNPAIDQVTVQAATPALGVPKGARVGNVVTAPAASRNTFRVELHNAMGQLVKTGNSLSGRLQLDLHGLNSGVYYITIINKEVKTTKKILVMR